MTLVDMCGSVCVLIYEEVMRRGVRLDPLGARLLSIHQKTHTFNPPPHEEHDAQGALGEELGEAEEVGACAGAGEESVLDLEPEEAVDTGCAECGGMGASSPVNADPMVRMSEEMAAMKARMVALEARIADLEAEPKMVYERR